MDKSGENILPLVIAGGFGKRLAPLSTIDLPKQFMHFFDNEESFFQKTIKRIRKFLITEKIVICINQRHINLVKEQLKKICEDNYILICEQESRNTFASVLLGIKIAEILKADTMFVSPADSFIENEDLFCKNIQTATLQSLITERHVVFGVKPTKVEDKYGYIKINSGKSKTFEQCVFFNVDRFIEKPELAKAKQFIEQGNYFWNSGHFVFNVEKLQEEIKKYQTKAFQIADQMKLIRKNHKVYTTDDVFLTIPNLQIDRAIIEKSKNLLCCKAEFDWCDIGSFETIEYLISLRKIKTFSNFNA